MRTRSVVLLAVASFAAGVLLSFFAMIGVALGEACSVEAELSREAAEEVPEKAPRLSLEPPVRPRGIPTEEESRPRVSFLSKGTYLSLSNGLLTYQTQGVKSVTFTVSRAYESNVVPFGWKWQGRNLMREVGKVTLPIDAPKEARVNGQLDVKALAEGRPGLYEVRAEAEGLWWPEECIVVLTDLGVCYGFDDHLNGTVAVRSIAQGTPVVGAQVEVFSKTNQLLLTGITDAQGLARLEVVAGAPLEDGLAKLMVRAGEDCAYVELGEGQHWTGDAEARPSEVRAMVFTDRGAVRPGEAVSLMALVRDAEAHPLAEAPVTFVVQTPSQETLTQVSGTTDREGVVTAPLTFSKEAQSGTYVVQLRLGGSKVVLGQETLYVSDFVPDRLKVQVAFASDSRVEVSAETYYGTPVREAAGSLRLLAEVAPFPESWRGWSVGLPETRAKQLLSARIEANDAVMFSLDQEVFHAPVALRAIADLAEPNGRTVVGSAEQIRFTRPAYLGLKTTEAGPLATLLLPEGSTLREATATAQVERVEWHYALVQTKDGAYRHEWDERLIPLDMIPPQVTVRPGVETPLDFGDLYPGRYRLTVTLADGTMSQTDFWHDAGEAGLRTANPSVLTFETDREAYLPGETATLSFEAPGKGSLLVMEGDNGSLANARSFTTEGGRVSLPIVVPADHLTGSWRVAVTFLPEDVEAQGRCFGLATLKVRQEAAHRAMVTLEAPEVISPEREVEVTVQLATPQGEPLTGEVLFFAVDESVLAMSDYKTPNPFAFFHGWQPANLLLGDTYGLLYPRLKIGPDGRIGGDTEAEVRLPEEQQVLARIVLPPQSVEGEATLRFKVPEDFQGALRLMAVATQSERVGSAERTLIVRSPVVLQGAAPRVVCPGDTFSVSLKVENLDLPEGSYTLTVTDGPTFTGTLAQGASMTHTLELPARTTLEAQVTLGDCTRSLRLPITVREPIPKQQVTTFTLCSGEPPEGADLVDEAAVAQTALDWLSRYPFDCTEQLVAQGLPYLFRKDALAKEQVAWVTQQMMTRKNEAGAFLAFPESGMIHDGGTLMAALFLAEQERLPWRTQRIMRDVAGLREQEHRGRAAFATWVLALEGDEEAIGCAEDLINAQDDDDAAFVAACALIRLGYAKEGGEIATEFLTSGKRPQSLLPGVMDEQAPLGFATFLTVRCGLTEALPADWLAALVTGQQRTTQGCAWTACALEALKTTGKSANLRLIRTTAQRFAVQSGQVIHVTREIVDSEGQPITTLRHGDLAWVKITFTLPRAVEDVALRDLLPGGLDYEDANLATRESVSLPDWAAEATHFDVTRKLPGEVRFFGDCDQGTTLVVYPVRAVSCGIYHLPATLVEAMYDPELTGACAPETPLTIVP